ncbi:four-carbon acid sugar kinase family protein [Primorskyibacter sp. 2E107]|uniref:four-carbon acid sugar kinase family protein n=1 Tax=Primorskyibacter sp. 2E107 TaxID=3403458 RepID=UPI003AF49C99
MIKPVLILADDLTGALDSSVGFADGLRRVVVARSPEAVSDALEQKPDVLAINTGSREGAEARAVSQVEAALAQLDLGAFGVIFKKVDSRLKGHVAVETGVLAMAARRARHVACPAIPDMGRIVLDGALCGGGVALPIPVAEAFAGSVTVPDAATNADLDALVRGELNDTLWIGARGLSFALARAMGVFSPRAARPDGPILIVNGSRDPITVAQIEALTGLVPVLHAPGGVTPDAITETGSSALSISEGAGLVDGEQAARRLAEGAARLARQVRPASIILCGGESAQACLDQLDVNSLRVMAEVQPGLPLFEAQMPWGPVQFVTKSGGFGVRTSLVDIVTDTKEWR